MQLHVISCAHSSREDTSLSDRDCLVRTVDIATDRFPCYHAASFSTVSTVTVQTVQHLKARGWQTRTRSPYQEYMDSCMVGRLFQN